MIAASSGSSVVLTIGFILIGIGMYFLPAEIAHQRHHHQTKAIFVLDLFLAWTVIGWIVCLAMALSATPGHNPRSEATIPQDAAYGPQITRVAPTPMDANEI